MKKSQLVVLTAFITLLAGATALWLVNRQKQKRRLAIVSDAGYETAYDIHYPLKYRRG
ncbi:MAG: hypothetical protein P4L51_06700 [Puia sp.]|nr:hypothetical protein [Puia sp.]